MNIYKSERGGYMGKKVILGMWLFLAIFSFTVFSQQAMKIDDVLKNPQTYKGSAIAIVGIAGTTFEGDPKTPRHYFLQDASGTIAVFSTKPWPVRGSRYAVTGSVALDAASGAVVIHEQSRADLDKSFRVRDIKNNPQEYPDPVTIRGIVTQKIDSRSARTYWYLLKDEWGDIVPVRSTKSHPEINQTFSITGLVTVDAIISPNEVFLSEDIRVKEAPLPGQAPPPAQPAQQVPSAAVGAEEPKETTFWSRTNILLIAGGAVVLIVFIILLISLMRKKPASDISLHPEFEKLEKPGEKKEELKLPEPQEVLEGDTIKMAMPPQGTLKMLPGRLVVLSGDQKIREIRFYKTKAEEENEITFGRAVGKPYTHIQLKEMTVSAKQAKLLYAGKKFTLISYAKTNPTRVNDMEVEENGMLELADGDKIQMGEVVFQFFSK